MNPHTERWNQRYAAKTSVWSQSPNQTLVEQVGALPAGKALDLGCGEGRNALWLAAKGWQVTAVDFASVALEKARQRSIEQHLDVNWVEADLASYLPPSGWFDLVFVCFLHTDSIERRHWLQSACEAVAPGGTFLYIGHDPTNPELGNSGPTDPDVLPSHRDVVNRLKGFEVEHASTHERTLGGETGHRRPPARENAVALDAVVRAVRRCSI